MTDFGLARQEGLDTSGLTRSGAVLGTPHYMAPEQVEGDRRQLGLHTDVWALGVIFYQLLTGVLPFRGHTLDELYRSILIGELIKPSQLVRSLPKPLETICLKMLERDPRRRYATASAVCAELQRWQAGESILARSPSRIQLLGRWSRRHRSLSAATLMGIVLVAVWWGQTWLTRWTRVRARIQAAEEHLDRARGYKRRFGELSEKLMATDPALRQRWELMLDSYEQADTALGLALRLSPGNAELQGRALGVGKEHAQVALAGGDVNLAGRVYRRLEKYGASPESIRRWLGAVDRARGARLKQRARRLGHILSDIERGLSRPERPRTAPLLQDYIREALGYREPQMIKLLGQALSRLTEKARKQGASVSWSQSDRDLAELLCRALGEGRHAEAVAPLADWLSAVQDEQLLVLAALAMCDTRRYEAQRPVLALQQRLGATSLAWRQILRAIHKIPDEPVRAKSSQNAAFYHLRGRIRYLKRNYTGAIEDLNRTLELAPALTGAITVRGDAHFRVF